MCKLTIFKILSMNSAKGLLGILTSAMSLLGAVTGPRYDGKYLHSKIRKLLGGTKMHETLTNVVIPTFDIQLLQPTIFSTIQVLITTNMITFS